ncbi:Fatty acid synthase [Hypsibius exemplaris]|uniref:Fatty acid synthase n=1 Tax=Hypsibius exemplaris TaxID=2072580 RepID=A0A1W0XEJ6_HYPEX|nr:Fatty acid synthase [Hypsibius exemplaris]
MVVSTNATSASTKDGIESPEDIVISGMSIRCSQSDNVEEFAQNLYDGINMVHENLQRCDEDHFGVPKQHGFIKDIRKFDATFFNVHPKQAEGMDPQLRILHEVAYESIIDGGVDPAELKNSNTGVFIGTSNSDAREAWTSADVSEIDGYSLIGTHRAFLANRLSFTFDLRGPSFGVDAACATSGVAINQGYLHIKHGVCDAALVGGVSLVYQPKVSYQILKLGLLCKDGMCKVFDEAADGYVRAEAIVCLLLQKRKNAKRIYATLLHSKINNDGFKEQGITFPCTESQGQLVAEVYAEAGVDPEDVEYVEAHGTGTKIGDPQETNGIALGFAGTRTKPLPIGAVKSNMGHSEHASGAVSVVKILIAMKTGIIPPNLHYKTPNPLIPALVDGRLKVVTEPMKWNSTLAGVNCFGFGGQNSHLILRGNPNVRKESVSDLQLFVYMGRTEDAAKNAMDFAVRYSDNPYVPYLLMESSFAKPASMPFRGYAILNGGRPSTVVDRVAVEQRPVWWIFSGQGTQWATMGKDMMRLAVFASTIAKCAQVLAPLGLNLVHIITTGSEEDFSDPIVSVVGITAIQIALIELLRLMEISPNGFVGHSAGEIGCAYADGGLSLEEAMLTAYWRGKAVKDAKLAPGAMAAVGLGWEKTKTLCAKYSDVTPACDNADDNVTVSGSATEISRLVADMKPENIFAKEVNSYGVAFHSPAMQKAAPIYLNALKKVLPSPKTRTARWLSTAFDETEWSSDAAKYASPEYFTHNLSSNVKFRAAVKKIPANAIVVEIAPHGLLLGLIKKALGDRAAPVALMKKGVPDNAVHFLETIGKLYILGLNPRVSNIFPKPALPAPRDTPFLGSVVRWDHSASWRIPHFTDFIHKGGKSAQHSSICDLADPLNQYYLDNIINGQAIFSVGGLLALVAKAYAVDSGNTMEKAPVLTFSDLEFHSQVLLEKDKKLQFGISVARRTGYFEIAVESDVVATGFVKAVQKTGLLIGVTGRSPVEMVLNTDNIYDEFDFRGANYGPQCRMLKSLSVDGTSAFLQCPSYEAAIDGLLQLLVLSRVERDVVLPLRIRSLSVDMPATAEHTRKAGGSYAKLVPELDLVLTEGLEIEGITWEPTRSTTTSAHTGLHQTKFVPFQLVTKEGQLSHEQALSSSIELALENISNPEIRMVELIRGSQATSCGQKAKSVKLPSDVKLQFNNFVLKADQNTEIEQGSATLLILQDYFSQSTVEKELVAVSSLLRDDGFVLISQLGNQTNFRSALLANGFTLLSEHADQAGHYVILGRKIPESSAGTKRPPVILALGPKVADKKHEAELQAVAEKVNSDADSTSRIWITVPKHGLDWVDTVIQLNYRYPDAGLRLIVDDGKDGKQALPAFSLDTSPYKEAVARDAVINIYDNGSWGSVRSIAVEDNTTENTTKPNVRTSFVENESSHPRVAYGLKTLVKATPGQHILFNVPHNHQELEAVLLVAKKIGLTIHVVGSTSPLANHTYKGHLAHVAVAQEVLKATKGQGVNIIYNLAPVSVLRESLRVISSTDGSYIEAGAADLDESSLPWATSKNVKAHLLPARVNPDEILSLFLKDNKLPFTTTNGPAPTTGALLHSSKVYHVLAAENEKIGVKVAYWLATQGAGVVHLYLTKAPTAVLEHQRGFFTALHTQLTVTVSRTAEDIFNAISEDAKSAGLFAIHAVHSAEINQEKALNTDTKLVEKVISLCQSLVLNHFVVLTSGTSAAESVTTSVVRRNAAGLSGLLLDVSTIVSSSENAVALHATHPEEHFVPLHQALSALKLALTNGGKGLFNVVPEGVSGSTDAHAALDDETGPQDKSYLPQAVAKIMGIKDFASLDMFLSLGDYGIDSLMAMELGRILERDFNLSLTLQEIRSLCIRDICLMSGATNAVEAAKFSEVRSEFERPVLLENVSKHYNLGELMPKATLVLLRQVQETKETLFIVHPMEGTVKPVLETLSNHLQVTAYGLNCTAQVDTTSMSALAASYIQEVKKIQPKGPYNLGGYSLGAGVAFEMALQLQQNNEQVRTLTLLDGSHSFVASFTKTMKSGYTVNPNMPPEEMEARKQSAFETAIVTLFVTQLVKTKRKHLTDMLTAASNFDERVQVAVKELQRCDALQHLSDEVLRAAIVSFSQRLKIADVYKPDRKYSGPITLIKCSEKMMRNLGEYYELDKVSSTKERIRQVTVPGNHEGFVLGESARLTARYVNESVFGA